MTRQRILVAGVGHDHLRDLSAGPVLIERLRRRSWPAEVQVEELIAGAVAVLYRLQEEGPFGAALFVAAEPRGRTPGSIHRYSWSMPPVSVEQVQARVADALTGIVSLDTLLVVAGHFGALPPRVRVIEIEPRDRDWGSDLSPPVAAALDRVERIARSEIEDLLH